MTKANQYSDKIATMISSITFSFLIIALWSYIVCINPTIYFFFGNCVFFLLIFWFNILYYKEALNKYIYYPLIFLFMFSVDFVIRRYGDGQHDQVGQALCDITFIITFIPIALSMFICSYISYSKKEIKNKKILLLKEVVYIIINIVIFFLLFVLLSMESFIIP